MVVNNFFIRALIAAPAAEDAAGPGQFFCLPPAAGDEYMMPLFFQA